MANVLPSGSCSAISRSAQSAWYSRVGRYGCVISTKPKTPRRGGSVAAWSIPSDMLGGMTLYNWRKALMGITSHQWVTGDNFNKGSYGTAYTYTLANGHTRTQSGFNLFKHVQDPTWEVTNLYQLSNGFPPIILYPSDITGAPAEPAAPAITAASWDGKDDISITLSNYIHDDLSAVAYYATVPNYTTPNGRALFMMSAIFVGPGPSNVFARTAPLTSRILKPWPSGSECLFGCRVWLAGFNPIGFALPSPIAAELITIP
jgi:hypothetical protein